MQPIRNQIHPFAVPMVFLRIGWMDRYQGQPNSDRISGGGEFVEQHGYGHEIFNFQGWDLQASYGQNVLRLEVKGLSGHDVCVELTPNEYAAMQRHRDSYRLCVVTSALTSPKLAVFAFSNDTQCWTDRDGQPLEIETIVAARCRA